MNHTITGTSANMHNVSETSKLLWEEDVCLIVKNQMGYAKAAYRGSLATIALLHKPMFERQRGQF